ncbi:MAG: Ppx/GppA family phosphatase, partial [Actinomycetota bacterium]|nr:Ppx/GppA family phosphatase [Actinomycetota bacterium]
SMTLEQRSRVPGLHPGRASVIVAGALILEQVIRLAEQESTRVSERDILYGMLLDAYASGA